MSSTETSKSAFNPTETWQLDESLEPSILKAREDMNKKDPKALIVDLQNEIQRSENGITYAVLKGNEPKDYSDKEALVIFNPFANAATPNMLVRTEFVREVAKNEGIRDAEGKLKPVIMLASPGIVGSTLKLTRKDRKQIRHGDLGPAARELLHAVSTLEIGKVSLLGASQGADLALAGALKAYSANLDVNRVAVGDPAGVEDRGLRKLAFDFGRNPSLAPSIERSGLDAQKESVGKGRHEGPWFIGSVITSPINNFDLVMGMSSNSFERNVQTVLEEGRIDRLVAGYGSSSLIAKPSAIEPSLSRLHDLDTRDVLSSIKIIDGNHTWGDQLTLLAKLYMRALS